MDLVLAGLGPLSRFAGRQKTTVCSILNRYREEIGCRHLAHVFLQKSPGHEETYISVTYPGRWLLNYAIRNYFSVDPVIRDDERADPVRILNHLRDSSGSVRAMLADAEAFGIGRSFIDVQVMPHSEYRGTVMFAFDIGLDRIEAFVAHERCRLIETARRVHLETLRARCLMPDYAQECELTADETRCVALIAEGGAYADIAAQLNWSEHRVVLTVKQVCDKLGSTNPLHMVTQCIAHGLLGEAGVEITSRNAPLSTRVFPPKPH
ncbi:autoinducer binding domain-containing protein [Rhizobium sp. TRM95111]|uniref:helix-turn-helix transcriptional regulator n=1 Tax=Rhizobium alarense TaxID=2846851 RepID=UPI001F3936E8|nr:autoinducer binding domain-containing protein [Rhizobium alarense]MCF3641738.1 autoinducer binding domain-containing protein [Rhizobium alarense]